MLPLLQLNLRDYLAVAVSFIQTDGTKRTGHGTAFAAYAALFMNNYHPLLLPDRLNRTGSRTGRILALAALDRQREALCSNDMQAGNNRYRNGTHSRPNPIVIVMNCETCQFTRLAAYAFARFGNDKRIRLYIIHTGFASTCICALSASYSC
jgi:hypothetical protein